MKLLSKAKNLPDAPGVYIFKNLLKEVIYVGKSVSLKKRVSSYFMSKNLGPKTNLLVKNIAEIKIIKVFSEFEALMLEAELIRKYNPFYNIQAKDDKSPIYIKITNEKIPQITTVRKSAISKKDYSKGPFHSAKETKEVLRFIRRIFPYCHHKNPKKPCLYVHLGLCPYPFFSPDAQKKYKKTILKIQKLLGGKTETVINNLNREMKSYAKVQMFEKANEIKKQIEKIQYVQANYHQPKEFLEEPNLVDDRLLLRLVKLTEILNLPKAPQRIECYDISNISGKLATGSMVVFIEGKPQKDQYRRFKIKYLTTPDDYQMLKQVLLRRFQNKWQKPDLIVIDGGKGQLNSALSALKSKKINIPIISLAKRLEQIFVVGNSKPISLPKEDPARQLVAQMRDEAHRFAITYHRNLRNKQLLI